MYNMSAAMGPRFAEVAREMTEKIRKLGPSPIKRQRASKGQRTEPVGRETVDDRAGIQFALCSALCGLEGWMIIADGKPIQEILAMIAPYEKIVLAGCKGA